MYYLVGAGIVLFLLIFIFVYIYKRFGKFNIINKVNNKYLKVIIKLLLIVFPFIIYSFVNAVVVIFHVFIFMALFDILSIIFKRKYSDLFGYIAIIVTAIYLGVGLYQNYHVYETKYTISTNKDIGTDSFKILQISDSHTGTTFDGNGFKELTNRLSKIETDIVVITGDLVDDSTTDEDVVLTCEALSNFNSKYGVYYIYGNHDKGYYRSSEFDTKLRNELKKNNVKILEDEVVDITDRIVLIGRQDKENLSRATIEELTKNIDKSKYIIDLNHQPNDFDNESKSGVDLVLTGHTHGGQLFPLGYIGVWTHANDEFKGMHKRGNTTFIVNTGVSDWEIKFKTGTKSEYTLIEVRGE